MVSEVTISDDSFKDWSPQGVRGAIRGAISSECFRDLGPPPSGIRILEGQSQDRTVFTALRGVRRVEADRAAAPYQRVRGLVPQTPLGATKREPFASLSGNSE